MKTLAKQIEYELQRGLWSHCAIYEDELQHFWPLDAPYREVRIAAFAAKYGFRLRFYHKGYAPFSTGSQTMALRVGVERPRG